MDFYGCRGIVFSIKLPLDGHYHIFKGKSCVKSAGPLLSGVWSVLNGLFLGAVILISNKIAGNNRINAKAAGIMMEKGKLVKTIYLSILTVTLAFGILFFADYFFKTDFRLWVLTLKAFDADKVLIGF